MVHQARNFDAFCVIVSGLVLLPTQEPAADEAHETLVQNPVACGGGAVSGCLVMVTMMMMTDDDYCHDVLC